MANAVYTPRERDEWDSKAEELIRSVGPGARLHSKLAGMEPAIAEALRAAHQQGRQEVHTAVKRALMGIE
ncbi:MAG: hypothetical protein WAO08_06035 [Hyphomicrobiaceae bacterium]